MTENSYRLKIDLKRRFSSEIPTFVQYDDARLEFELLDLGVAVDLTGVTKVEFAHKRPDGVTIVGNGTVAGNIITYDYQGTEMAVPGIVLTSFSVFDEDGSKISVQPFNVQIASDLRDALVNPADPAYGALQTLIAEVDGAVMYAEEAGAFAETQGDYAKTQGDYALSVGQANVNIPVAPVANFSAIATTYPTPALGTKVQTTDNGRIYRWDGTTWQYIEEMNSNILTDIQTQLSETARQTTTLSTGVAVVSGNVDAIADVEIEGRTLTSLANSNLEATKQYVLADKKTKVIVDGVTQSGVAKFTKGTTTVSTANFVGKVTASNVANPHKYASTGNVALLAPSAYTWDGTQSSYDAIKTLNGVSTLVSPVGSGIISQQLFSFDIIAEIERKLGVIPRSTLAEKVQWCKDNVESLVANWHGFGSSVGGNRSNFSMWNINTNAWETSLVHTGASVTKITNSSTSPSLRVDANGFMHLLAYAEASDGVTASTISTDYIDLVVTLKATAQLNTRATVIRVENFEGKVSGSTVENPHVAKRGLSTSLAVPVSFSTELDQTRYASSSKLDGTVSNQTATGNGEIAQQLFSFNLIEAVERNVGRIPRSSVAEKVQWLKDNISKVTANWHGFGSSAGGNKANFTLWAGGSYYGATPHSVGSVARISYVMSAGVNLSASIQSDGFVHYLAYAEPSDGTTASTINTDYIDLEIELRPTADFTRPKVALYEVASDSYSKILVDWNADAVVSRYPSVEGTQHLQGVGVIAEGENLLPPFSEWSVSGGTSEIVSPYNFKITATGAWQGLHALIPVVIGQSYTFSIPNVTKRIRISSVGADGVTPVTAHFSTDNFATSFSFQATSNLLLIRLNSDVAGTFTFTNPMLTLGNVAKPFVPRNPSYLYADVKLGAIGTVADKLYEADGQRFVRKVVEKDVVLGGDLAWSFVDDKTGHKRMGVSQSLFNGIKPNSSDVSVLNHRGLKLRSIPYVAGDDIQESAGTGGTSLNVSVLDADTGFAEAFTPTANDIKRYFNGWKYSDGVTWTSVTGNAQTATAQVALDTKPTDYTPYKLSYALATPQIVNVTDKVEGSLKVNGSTQVEALSGVVRREKVTPYYSASSSAYYINASSFIASNLFKNKASKIIAIYKNGAIDNKWVLTFTNANGLVKAHIYQTDFDPTAEYTVTYIALDKHLLTANPMNLKLTYAMNIRSSLEDIVGEVQDNTTMLSVHEKAIVDLYVRVKALGG